MKVAVKDLTDTQVNHLVSKIEGVDPPADFCFDWNRAGRVMMREDIIIDWNGNCAYRMSNAAHHTLHHFTRKAGALVAAMKCFIEARMGATVELPDDIT